LKKKRGRKGASTNEKRPFSADVHAARPLPLASIFAALSSTTSRYTTTTPAVRLASTFLSLYLSTLSLALTNGDDVVETVAAGCSSPTASPKA